MSNIPKNPRSGHCNNVILHLNLFCMKTSWWARWLLAAPGSHHPSLTFTIENAFLFFFPRESLQKTLSDLAGSLPILGSIHGHMPTLYLEKWFPQGEEAARHEQQVYFKDGDKIWVIFVFPTGLWPTYRFSTNECQRSKENVLLMNFFNIERGQDNLLGRKN